MQIFDECLAHPLASDALPGVAFEPSKVPRSSVLFAAGGSGTGLEISLSVLFLRGRDPPFLPFGTLGPSDASSPLATWSGKSPFFSFMCRPKPSPSPFSKFRARFPHLPALSQVPVHDLLVPPVSPTFLTLNARRGPSLPVPFSFPRVPFFRQLVFPFWACAGGFFFS